MRRRLLLVSALAMPSVAHAQRTTWPTQPITLVVTNGPGGTTDIAARLIAGGMHTRLGQPLVVENRPGGDGSIAIRGVLRARDRHTILCAYSGYIVGTPALVPDLGYNVERDLIAVGGVMDAPHAVLVHPSVPATTLAELIAHVRANPGQLNYASTGIGSVQHLGTEMFAQQAGGLSMEHVPYRAVGPAIQDLLAGRVHLFITTIPPVSGLAREGRLRALAVAAGQARSPVLPGVPSAAEAGMPRLDVVTWVGLYAPSSLAESAVTRLSNALRGVLDDEEVRRHIGDQGASPAIGGRRELAERTRRELAAWRAVVRAGGIRAG